MPIRAVVSQSYYAKLHRIKRLPRVINGMLEAKRKRDAVGVIESFQDGIRSNSFRLHPLKPETVTRKARQGYKRPRAPLYGKGDDERNSYINMWRIVRIKNGYRVRPRSARHWKVNLKLSELFEIHEKGATIQRGKATIVIPPRPAWERAQKRYLKKMATEEIAPEVRAAIRELLRTGSMMKASAYMKRARSEARRHEANS